VGGRFENTALLLLHHTGAKSGVRRVSPLAYQATDGGYAVFASNAGRDSHPAWYHNLLARPRTSVEVGTEEIPVSAWVAGGEERVSIWDRQKERSPGFARYEAGTSRRIPVVLLEPVTSAR
jgi:deazaflavin-dependent oxidoreductase (nitroreductase family)